MAPSNKFPFFIFVLGAPGAGKGTLCAKLAEQEGFYHLSLGDYLRIASTESSASSEKIIPYVRAEELVPDAVVKEIFDEDILPMVRAKRRPCIIVDGFPRKLSQIPDWGGDVPQLVLFFDCPKDIAASRVVRRGRGGASPELVALIFENRYKHFEAENPKILEHYASKDEHGVALGEEEKPNLGRIVKVDTSTNTEESWAALKTELDKSFKWKAMMGEIRGEFETVLDAVPEKQFRSWPGQGSDADADPPEKQNRPWVGSGAGSDGDDELDDTWSNADSAD